MHTLARPLQTPCSRAATIRARGWRLTRGQARLSLADAAVGRKVVGVHQREFGEKRLDQLLRPALRRQLTLKSRRR